MSKKMISKKLEFSLQDMPIYKLKKNKVTKKVNSINKLLDKDFIYKALWQCLIDKDIISFKEILRGHIEVCNKQKISKKAKISTRTLYRILSPEGNPTLKSISNVIHALYA